MHIQELLNPALQGSGNGPQGLDLWLPNRKQLTSLFYPAGIQLPDGGIPRWIGAAFLAVGALKTVSTSIQLHPAFLAISLLGVSLSGQSFGVQLIHNGPTGQRNLFGVNLINPIALGTAQHPLAMTEPELFANSDSVRIRVKNTTTAAGVYVADSFWVAIFGCDLPDDVLGVQ